MASSGTGNVRVMCCRSSYETIRGSKNPSFPHEKLARGSPAGFLFVGATTKIIWESLSRVGSNSWPIGRAPHITTCDLMIRTFQGMWFDSLIWDLWRGFRRALKTAWSEFARNLRNCCELWYATDFPVSSWENCSWVYERCKKEKLKIKIF